MLGGTWGMEDAFFSSINMPVLPEDLYPSGGQNPNNRGNRNNTRNPSQNPFSWGDNNPFLDGDDGFGYTEPERAPVNIFSMPDTPPRPEGTEPERPVTDTQQDDDPANAQSDTGYETAAHGPEIPAYNPLLD
jgi:hypothetical protein